MAGIGVFVVPCEILEHVEPGDALLGQQQAAASVSGCCRIAASSVAGVHLLTLRALHVQDRGLQHAAERRRLLGLVLLAAPQRFDRSNPGSSLDLLRSTRRSAPQAPRMRSPSGSCASA